jgi:protein SCO1/2
VAASASNLTMPELTQHNFREHVEQLSSDPAKHSQLLDLLREDHELYDQRGASTIVLMRGWVMLTIARTSLPDAALPFLIEDLDTAVDAYLVGAAAAALRSYPQPNPAFAPFVVRAITNIRYRDERLSFESYGAFAIGKNGTSPVRELLTTLAWLGPNARAAISDIESLRAGPTALSKKYQPTLEQILNNLNAGSADDCCQLPDSVKGVFSWMRITRTSSSSIESTVFEDQNGQNITFGEFFHGRPSIVVFFYTRCDNPLKCSLTITKLARIQKLLENKGLADQINTAGITYDPGFDLSERLLNYGQHRGVHFAPQHRLLRSEDGLNALRKHFQLGVNFVESLVNRHRIELYILDAKGQTAGYFGRILWNEQDVVERATEVLRENRSSPAPSRLRATSPLFGTAVALGLALFPKCPFCWAAYLSLFGIAGLESIPYSPWLQPLLAILLLSNLTSVWFRARATGRMIPFYLVTAGALTIIASKVFAAPETAGLTGVFLTLAGSVWSAFSKSLLKRRI